MIDYDLNKKLSYLSLKIDSHKNTNEIDIIVKKILILIDQNPKNQDIPNMLIKAFESISDHDLKINLCLKYINNYETVADLYYIISKSYLFKKEINKSITSLKKAIKINNEHYLSYYLLGNVSWQNLQIDDAIINFKKCLKINPNFKKAKSQLIIAKKERLDLLTFLTYQDPKKFASNPILESNNKLRQIKINIKLNYKITDNYIINLYEKMINSISGHEIDFEIEASQIHRETTMKYECKRHFEIFDTFKIIPENCFSCFKIQILPRNVVELIKLYVVFDILKPKINLTRKCMIELRPKVNGAYKGFIYCIGIEEAKETLNIINPILDRAISSEIPRLIKRGCSEYYEIYPKFKEVNSRNSSFMKYDLKWKEKEDIIDREISKRKKEEIIQQNSLEGICLKDLLIINNWLYYAKEMGDETYKIISEKPLFSKYIHSKLVNNIK